MKRLRPLLPLFFVGAIAAVGLPPLSLWPITLCALGYFSLRFQGLRRKRSGFWAGWLFALGYFTAGLYWVSNSLFVHIEQFWWALPFALLGLPVILALFWGFFCVFAVALTPINSIQRTVTLILAICLAELARGTLFTGFPWNEVGLIWSDVYLMVQSASLWGLLGLSFITLTISFLSIHFKNRFCLAVIALLLLVTLGYGFKSSQSYTKEDTTSSVRIVQGNIAQKEKWIAEKLPLHIANLLELSAQDSELDNFTPDFIIWPETSMISNYFEAEVYRDLIDQALGDKTLITGILSLPSKTRGYANSLYVYARNSDEVIRYDKHHLVPFGEYIPFNEFLNISSLVGIEGFEAGQKPKPFKIGNLNVLPLICYEIIFPKYAQSNPRSDVIINITNDAWYGNSSGPYQHLAIARFRAIEQGVPILRAANTGISAIIAPDGSIDKSLELQTRGVVDGAIPKAKNGLTLYSRFGLYIQIGFIIVMILSLIVRQQKNQLD